jgi:hypothetical protein
MPALFYWLIIRRYQLPLTTLIAAFGCALAIGYFLIPKPHQQYLDWASHGVIVAEVVLVVTVVINLRRLVHAYHVAAKQSADFIENLHRAFTVTLGKSFSLLVFEIALFRYAVLGWGAKVECQAGQTSFGSHRNSGFIALIATVCMLSVIETAAVHLLVQRWSPSVAWVLFILDLYTLLFLVAHLHAVRLRPTILTAEAILIRIGLVWRLQVDRHKVTSIKSITEAPTDSGILNLAGPLVTSPNLLLTFAEPVTITGIYGMQRSVRCVALYVDRPAELVQILHSANKLS